MHEPGRVVVPVLGRQGIYRGARRRFDRLTRSMRKMPGPSSSFPFATKQDSHRLLRRYQPSLAFAAKHSDRQVRKGQDSLPHTPRKRGRILTRYGNSNELSRGIYTT